MVLPGIPEIRSAIDAELEQFTRLRASEISEIDIHLAPVASVLTEYVLDGGKRFRPIFAYLGYLGSGATPSREVLRACAALELVHVCALIHDDVMDGSDARRNKPALHKKFEELHRSSGYAGDPAKFGIAAAILLGDLALVWSDQLLLESGISTQQFNSASSVFHQMRAELMAGQYLDVLEGSLGKSDRSRSLKIARYKSGRYSIERPLIFGAALAGATSTLRNSYSKYGLPLGEAFQLRDDILGVFGETEVTGKPSGDDIREGKRTVLMALVTELVSSEDLAQIEAALGNSTISESELENVQKIIIESGALSKCEELITSLLDEALLALNNPEIDSRVVGLLRDMGQNATKRKS